MVSMTEFMALQASPLSGIFEQTRQESADPAPTPRQFWLAERLHPPLEMTSRRVSQFEFHSDKDEAENKISEAYRS